MIKIRYITTLILLIQLNVALTQNPKNKHNLVFWGEGGYSSVLNNSETLTSDGGFGYGAGIGYEWHKNNFILHTGLEFQNLRGRLNLDDFIHTRDMVDSEGDEYLAKYYFSESNDHYSLGYINVPLMAGFQFNKIYFLTGGKLGINLFGNSKTRSIVKSTGDYPNLIGEFEDMPNHYFMTLKEEEKYGADLNIINFSLSAELGFNIVPQREKAARVYYRLAVFADYGLVNIRSNATENLLLEKNVDYYRPVLNSFSRSLDFKDDKFNTLFLGVKFSVLLGFKTKYDCRCDWE